MSIRPPCCGVTWDDCEPGAQASLIAFEQIREAECAQQSQSQGCSLLKG